MAQRTLYLVPALSLTLLFAAGAWETRERASGVQASFVAEPAPLAPHAGLGGAELLDRAVSALAPDRVTWLKTSLWQKMNTPELRMEAEGFLVRGPNHCVRLEMTVRAGGQPAKMLVVSDGVVLAKVHHTPEQAARSLCSAMPAGEGEHAAKEAVLLEAGCAGPRALLEDVKNKLKDLQVEAGQCQGQSVLRVSGVLPSANENALSFKPSVCHVFLDAKTLWPVRVEWWGKKRERDPLSLMLQMEFRDPEVNRPLSHDDCARLFSYQPNPGE